LSFLADVLGFFECLGKKGSILFSHTYPFVHFRLASFFSLFLAATGDRLEDFGGLVAMVGWKGGIFFSPLFALLILLGPNSSRQKKTNFSFCLWCFLGVFSLSVWAEKRGHFHSLIPIHICCSLLFSLASFSLSFSPQRGIDWKILVDLGFCGAIMGGERECFFFPFSLVLLSLLGPNTHQKQKLCLGAFFFGLGGFFL